MTMGMRFYHTPHGAFPSITTVLGGSEPAEKTASLEGWRNSLGHAKAAAVTKASADHGTMVHLLVERSLKGEEVFAPVNGRPIPDQDKAAFNALKLKLRNITEVWGQEQSVYSPSLEIAGRFDCIGIYKGVPSIIDFKTAMNKIKGKADIADYELQLRFYATAHNELFGTDIQQGVILMVAQTGFPLEFVIDLRDKTAPLLERAAIFWEKTLSKL